MLESIVIGKKKHDEGTPTTVTILNKLHQHSDDGEDTPEDDEKSSPTAIEDDYNDLLPLEQDLLECRSDVEAVVATVPSEEKEWETAQSVNVLQSPHEEPHVLDSEIKC
jgi:hypothetical protein